ncbi:transketolase C-terminal domain-containing protein [Marinifilum flexuosum]|uniref:Pyruvate ferredoxin oxidoreductase alpha subunit n=1 Tax=Marinifilum flexuosum TaxID=1117708 RepID=A0A419X6Z3_9BACT|nr:transketolase C-terminal domain-containing protein [Marinifilum flexuosum]RKE03501.1 pyruvate ferredoxin oxidoreductase alpha subunit [Marinifilum flexuosum]
MKTNKIFISGDEAVAQGVKLSRPHVVAAYPITPQTITVERLSEMVEAGEMDAEYMHVESEHSAISATMGASAVGARTFTASSSQGLLYMAEGLHYCSGGRWPVVMMNANRSVALPWSIYGDQRDSLSLLDSGWIQVYVEDAQEALDMIIQAYKIAEHKDVLTPMMVNLDGFILTHTYELVEIPDQEMVDQFLPPFETPNKMSFENPKNLGFSSRPDDNTEFKYQQNEAMFNAIDVIRKTDEDFTEMFGRKYHGMVEEYMCEDADVVLVALGSVCGTVRVVVDKLRAEGKKVGLLKIRYMRPFPVEEVKDLAKRVKAMGVIDKDISFGYEGTVYTNVNSAISQIDKYVYKSNFVGGLGGRDITKAEIEDMYNKLYAGLENKSEETVEFFSLNVEGND